MPTVQGPALVLQVRDYSETSQIVTLYLRSGGKVRGLAKGAKRPKGSFGGALDTLWFGEALVLDRQGRGMNLLTGFSVRTAYPELRRSRERLASALWIVEILLRLTPEGDPHPAVLDAASDALHRLEAGDPPEAALTPFEGRFLIEAGYRPQAARCVACDRTPGGGDAFFFSGWRGGLLCPGCRRADWNAAPMPSEAARDLEDCLVRLQSGDGPAPLPAERRARLQSWLTVCLSAHMEEEPRTLRYLR